MTSLMKDDDMSNVVEMTGHRPLGSDNGTPTARAGEGGGQRQRRKKKLDGRRVTHLLRDFAYQYGSDYAWDTINRIPIKISHLRHTFGNDEVRIWMASERRRVIMADDVVFDPSEQCAPECVNLFGGLTMQPKAGNWEPIRQLLWHLCDEDEEIVAWILDWQAIQLQQPGIKLPTAIIMHGDEGSGKNVYWERIWLPVLMPYASIVGQNELENKYTGWLSKRLFILGDEVLSRQEMRHMKGKLKSMISGKWMQIEEKFEPVRMEANHVNLVFLSNELQPNALDASDRRYLVVWTPPKREPEYYKAVMHCADNGGREAFMHALLERDISAFDPYAPPPVTKAKTDLIDLSRPSAERFWLAWCTDEAGAPRHACSAAQAYRLYRRWCMTEGERYPINKVMFARTVARIAGDALTVRVAKIGPNLSARMWLPAPPPADVEFGAWARDAIDEFETYVKTINES